MSAWQTVSRRSALHLCWLAATLLLTGCIDGINIHLSNEGFNEKLRPDRAALTAEQRAISKEALRNGPWRTGAAEIAPFLRPDDPLARVLPQSDCWAMANSERAGRDAMLTNWEAIATVSLTDFSNNPIDDWIDPDDGRLDVGLCRFNDPVTRLAPVTRSGDRTAAATLECGVISNNVFTGMWYEGRNFPDCISDASVYYVRLDAARANTRDAFARCDAERAAIGSTFERISRGIDFWRDPTAEVKEKPQDKLVAACAVNGQLIAPSPTRYRVSFLNATRDLEPMVQPHEDGALITRPLAIDAAGVQWGATTQADPATPSTTGRWTENFASSLVVTEVRIVRPTVRVTALAQPAIPVADIAVPRPPKLCVQDRESPTTPAGVRCRFSCEDTDPADSRLHYVLDDRYCRDFQDQSAAPRLTPTYAIDSAQAALTAGLTPPRGLRQPLRFSLDDTALAGAWIEFKLAVTGGAASMRSSLTAMDAGALRVGQSRRVTFRVDNIGAQNLRVQQIDLMTQSAHPQDFRIELPFDPQPVPLGPVLAETATGAMGSVGGRSATLTPLLRITEAPTHLRLAGTPNTTLTLNGVALRRMDELLWRDVERFPAGWPATLEPGQPVVMQSWRARPLPFVLPTRDAFLISVVATPRAFGARSAWLRVLGVSLVSNQPVEIRVPLNVRGLYGPIPQFLPERLLLSAPAPDAVIRRNVLLTNDGDVATTLSPPVLTAPGGGSLGTQAARLRVETPDGATGTIGSGASRLARVSYRGTCTSGSGIQTLNAELRWATPDGTAVLPIQGTTPCGP